ncbi:MAG TPA: hypothetical protein PLM14_01505 [Candidatus Hydrogenedentes bacterium]|nr:hypothetical protein [Candidatus Hydrogenedentota bacterium]HQH52117.1 hypothetical protein [Candidatus Hydrogenedentota bacterium]
MTVRHNVPILAAAAVAAFLASCGGEGPVAQISDTRTVESLPKAAAPDATSAQRFGFEQATARPSPAQGAPGAETVELPFTWTAPEGWQQAPERPMRVVTFTTGPNHEAECYIAILGSSGGSVAANINRWRTQMGQEPLTGQKVAALPVIDVLGQPSPWVELRGTFTNQAGEPAEDTLMLGLVCPVETFNIFVKMTGPADLTGAQRDKFLAFCKSLTWSRSANQ